MRYDCYYFWHRLNLAENYCTLVQMQPFICRSYISSYVKLPVLQELVTSVER